MVFNAVDPIVSEVVYANAVGLLIYDMQKFCTHFNMLCWCNQAFKYGILNALSVIQADFGNLSKSPFSGGTGGGDIVGDQDVHYARTGCVGIKLFSQKCRVGIKVFAEISSEEAGLDMWE